MTRHVKKTGIVLCKIYNKLSYYYKYVKINRLIVTEVSDG